MRKIREMRWDTMISEIFCEEQDKNFSIYCAVITIPLLQKLARKKKLEKL